VEAQEEEHNNRLIGCREEPGPLDLRPGRGGMSAGGVSRSRGSEKFMLEF
jgi:hypothetical protein